MYNNGYGTFNQPTGGYYSGMVYQDAPKLSMTQGLTKEQLDSLRKSPGGFALNISNEDILRSYCTHRLDNKFMVKEDEEGNFICSLCGAKFKPFNGTGEEARQITEHFLDFMETTKMQALKLPPKTIQDVFQIMPVIKHLPELYEYSRNDYKQALGMNDGYYYGQENNAFAMYQNMINPMAGNGYYDPAMMNMGQPMYGAQPNMYPAQQPMYGGQPQQYAQPMYNQQPMMQQPMYGQPAPQQNPFNVNSAPAQAPQTQPAPQSNTNEQVTVTKKLTD